MPHSLKFSELSKDEQEVIIAARTSPDLPKPSQGGVYAPRPKEAGN